MTAHLTETAKQLLPKARIVSFETWKTTYPPEIIQIFQNADNESRYLTDEDIEKIQNQIPNLTDSLKTVQYLRNNLTEIINEARQQLLTQYPKINQPGGELYPPERSEACWRDFWQFLRCITYAIAAQKTDYLSPQGLHYMELLYRELRVPLNAMVAGLENLKTASLKHLQNQQQIAPYFDRLITEMSRFK